MSLIENIAFTRDDRPNSWVPPAGPKEQKLLQRLAGIYVLADREKRKWTKSWKTNYKFYMGDQWGPRPSWMSRPMENHVHSKTETIVPILTDNRPKIDVQPRAPEFAEYAQSMQYLLDYHWDRNGSGETLPMVARNALVFGKGFFYPYYNPETGMVCMDSVNPQDVTPDADAISIPRARVVFMRSRLSYSQILAYWPEAEGKLRPGSRTLRESERDFSDSLHMTSRDDQYDGYEYPLAAGDPFTRIVPWVGSDLSGIGSETDGCDVVQTWIKDTDMLTDHLRDPETNDPMFFEDGSPVMYERMKYPGGRHVVLCANRVIHDAPNPYEHGEIPLIEFNCYPFPGEFWPVSAVSNLINPQKMLNKVNGQILDNAKLMGNGQWLVENGSGVVRKRLNGKPGLVVRVNRNYKVEKIRGAELPSFISHIPDSLRAAIDNISGVFDVTQGRSPSGITAGVAIEQLQEAAQTRIRLLVRNLEYAIAAVGRQEVALMQQFYTEPRHIRILDEMGNFQFLTVTPEMIRGQWEVVVAAGSTLPRSREARQREALELMDRGLFDAEDVFDWIDHPGKYKALRKLKEREAMQSELQGLMGGQPGASGSMGGAPAPPGGPPPGKKPQVERRGFGQAGPPR